MSFGSESPNLKTPLLRLLNQDLSLCNESDFFRFLKESGVGENEQLFVISVTGNYAAGKSTLLNHLFFQGHNIFDSSDREGTDALTLGVQTTLVKIPNPLTGISLNVLLLDSEGLSGPKPDSLDAGALLTLRLLLISDLVIHNSSTSLQKTDLEHLKHASYRLYRKRREHQAPPQKPNLLFFIQRTPLKYQGVQDLLKFFPDESSPDWFPNFDLTCSRDKIRSTEDGIRLELDVLQKKITQFSAQRHKTTGRTLWNHLAHLDKNLPKPNPDKLISDGWDNCPAQCLYCGRFCDESRFDPQHIHVCESSECSEDKNISYKCRKCLIGERKDIPESNAVSTLWTPNFFYGPLWSCSSSSGIKHGDLAYQFSWTLVPPFLQESRQFRENVIGRKEHHFGKEPLPPPPLFSPQRGLNIPHDSMMLIFGGGAVTLLTVVAGSFVFRVSGILVQSSALVFLAYGAYKFVNVV